MTAALHGSAEAPKDCLRSMCLAQWQAVVAAEGELHSCSPTAGEDSLPGHTAYALALAGGHVPELTASEPQLAQLLASACMMEALDQEGSMARLCEVVRLASTCRNLAIAVASSGLLSAYVNACLNNAELTKQLHGFCFPLILAGSDAIKVAREQGLQQGEPLQAGPLETANTELLKQWQGLE
ncbi:hypothetical protein C2E21_3454 [Chlorella sorokiniana]|uniref:Uncharacterized protein n=1 Tax=Chlorella sorokiniana TaxID=3076 RepID=A0A2P6TVE1_CHLSO|nr:hypothetical protein C2E21_3454 [Chlorella sorokiniana]|eukprot:PRW58035.1 hypothetical protein C2E21_3454 [Chlorella sorokiniana]